MSADAEQAEDETASSEFVLLNGAVHVEWLEKGCEPCRKACDGCEVQMVLRPSGGTSCLSNIEQNLSRMFIVLGEEDSVQVLHESLCGCELLRAAACSLLAEPWQPAVASDASVKNEAAEFTQRFTDLLHSCLLHMGDKSSVKLRRCSEDGPGVLEVALESLEPGPWDLNPRARLDLAGRKRLLGNRHMQAGRYKKAFSRYKDALMLVRIDEDFIEDSDDEQNKLHSTAEQVDRSAGVDLEDVRAERERCLANLAAVSLKLSEFSSCLKYCEWALKLNQGNTKMWFRKARAQLSLGSSADAEHSFLRAAKLLPQDIEISKGLKESRDAMRIEREERLVNERSLVDNNSLTALWEGAADERQQGSTEPKKRFASNEEREREVEFNKRELMYHLQKNREQMGQDAVSLTRQGC